MSTSSVDDDTLILGGDLVSFSSLTDHFPSGIIESPPMMVNGQEWTFTVQVIITKVGTSAEYPEGYVNVTVRSSAPGEMGDPGERSDPSETRDSGEMSDLDDMRSVDEMMDIWGHVVYDALIDEPRAGPGSNMKLTLIDQNATELSTSTTVDVIRSEETYFEKFQKLNELLNGNSSGLCLHDTLKFEARIQIYPRENGDTFS